jgi:ribosomal protein S18 acetylase RimI-like enzyme
VLFVAQAEGEKRIAGTVVYVGNMRYYSPLGIAAGEQDGAGCRLLAVAPWAQGQGVGRQLTEECISQAKKQQKAQLILHSTQAMQVAWKMYEAMGFKRAEELDFLQGNLPVFGFRLPLA